jgi:hypothetical protein
MIAAKHILVTIRQCPFCNTVSGNMHFSPADEPRPDEMLESDPLNFTCGGCHRLVELTGSQALRTIVIDDVAAQKRALPRIVHI